MKQWVMVLFVFAGGLRQVRLSGAILSSTIGTVHQGRPHWLSWR
jgi:hypothetical protein